MSLDLLVRSFAPCPNLNLLLRAIYHHPFVLIKFKYFNISLVANFPVRCMNCVLDFPKTNEEILHKKLFTNFLLKYKWKSKDMNEARE